MNILIAYACLGLSMSFTGMNITLSKIVVSEVPVILFAAMRFTIATAILAFGMPLERTRTGLEIKNVGPLFLQSLFGCFLFGVFILYGVSHTSAISAGVITSILPSTIAVLAWLLLREKLPLIGMLAVILAVTGIASLNLHDAISGGQSSLFGNTLVLLAVFSEAMFAILSRFLSQRIHPWGMAFAVNLFALLLFLPLAIPQALEFSWSTLSLEMWLYIIFYSITASVLSFLLWYRGVAHVPANIAGLFTGMMPVAATLSGVLLLGEMLSTGQFMGMLLVLGAIALGARSHQPLRKPS